MLAAVLINVTMGVAHGQLVMPPDKLISYGIPPISQALVAKVQAYTEFKPSSIIAWHPTQASLLIRARLNDTDQLHLVAAPGVKPVSITDFPDAVHGAWFQPGKGEYILFERGYGDDEGIQLFRMNLATKAVTAISDAKEHASAPAWSHQGDRIVYTTTKTDLHHASRLPVTKLIIADPLAPATAKVIATFERGRWSNFRFSPDDKRLVFSEVLSASESHLWTMDVATGKRQRVTAERACDAVPVFYGPARFSRNGKQLFATSDRDSEHRRLVLIDVSTSDEKVLTAKLPYDVSEFSISTAAKRIAFVTDEVGASVLRFLDLDSFAELPRPALVQGEVSGLRWKGNADDDNLAVDVMVSDAKGNQSDAGAELAFNVTSSRSPGDVYSWNFATTRITRWTHSGSPTLNPLDFVEPKLVRWKSAGEEWISGFLYQPDARKFPGKRPVAIHLQGGPASLAPPAFIGRNNYLVNESGIAVLYPNMRGSTGFGKTFLDKGMKRWDAVNDFGGLLDWINQQPDLDASKVMVKGGSDSGALALAVSTQYADRISGAIVTADISNRVTLLTNTESYRRNQPWMDNNDDREPLMRKILECVSPLNNAERIKKPLFVVQGKRDPRVSTSETERILAQLKKQGAPVWFLMANDEGQGFAKKSNADFLFYAQVKFMEQTLLRSN